MAFNILDMVTDQITPENIGTVAKFLGEGEDASSITKAISAAAPLLLGGMLNSTSKPEGKDLFNRTVDQADPGILDNLAGLLGKGGGANNSMVSSGLAMLASLFGDNKLGMLTKALAGFSGLSSNSSKSLLGVAAPMLMGMLSKKKQDDGLDNNGLLSMLTGQKNNIAKAISPEMSKSFSGHGLLDGLVDQAGDMAYQAAHETKSLFMRLLPIIGILLLGLLLWYFISKANKPQPIETATTYSAPAVAPVKTPRYVAPSTAVEIVEETLTVGDVDLKQSLTAVFDKTNQIFSGVTDTDSANAAMNGLAEVNQNLDSILNLAQQLPPAGKQTLAELTKSMTSGLDTTINQVYKVPGAGAILGDGINTFRQKLAALTSL